MVVYRTGAEKIVREYEWSNISPTIAVLETIAVFEHDDPSMTLEVLESPLQTYIETDALDTIAASDNPVTIDFSTPKYHVRVSGNTVVVTAAEHSA